MLDLKDIYHPTLAHYYSLNLLIFFIITTLIMPPAIYIIFTQSKNAQVFKYLLINQLIWSYIFWCDYCIEGTVPLFPLPASYSVGLLKYLSYDSMAWIHPIHFFIGLGYTQAYFFSSLYRVTYSTAFCKVQLWFEEPKRLLLLTSGTLIVTTVIMIVPFFLIKYDAKFAFEEIAAEYPILKELQRYEPLIVASPHAKLPNSTALSFALNALLIYVPTIYIAHIIVSIIFFRQVLNPKNSFSEATKKKFMILVHAKLVQIIIESAFLSIPFLLQFAIIYIKPKNGPLFTLLLQFVSCYHMLFEIIALFYFVKPYREYLVQLFCKSHLANP